ncbi:MAG: hypothetical protein IBJ11_00385 [Phycisphaerales bacterium]|nr:hypothetical protein [Phycisphaerales bacterium]
MGVTAKLLALYRVDQQLRGLRSRLRQAEGYLKEQERLLAELSAKSDALAGQVRQLEATAHNDENEFKGLDAKIEKLRERMNTAKTSKEHGALLTEISTLKADRSQIEERALESMTKLDALRKQLAEFQAARTEREKVRVVARKERDEREVEIKDRVAELENERSAALAQVPKEAMKAYSDLMTLDPDNVMAAVEEQDRRSLEYTCGACYTHLPIEQVSVLLKKGDITKCPSCSVLLYMEQDLKDSIAASQEKKAASQEKKKGGGKAAVADK